MKATTPPPKLIMTVLAAGCALLVLGSLARADEPSNPGAVGPRALFYDQETPESVRTQPAKPPGAKPDSSKPTTTAKPTAATAKPAETAKKPPARPPALALRATVRLLDGSGGYTEVPPTRVFRSGEQIRLGFTSTMQGYFYLATIGSSGEAKVVVPSDGQSVVLNRDVTYEFPVSRKVFTFKPPEGKEEIYALLSETPLAAIEIAGGRQIAVSGMASPGGGPRPSESVASLVTPRDLVVEEDDKALYAMVKAPSEDRKPPIVLKLTLEHRGSR